MSAGIMEVEVGISLPSLWHISVPLPASAAEDGTQRNELKGMGTPSRSASFPAEVVISQQNVLNYCLDLLCLSLLISWVKTV